MPQPENSANHAPDGDEADAQSLDRWLQPFVSDSGLWPVLIVALLCLATFGAAALLIAIGRRNWFAIGVIAAGVVASVDLARPDLRRRRVGATSGILLALWLLSALLAFIAVAAGVV